MCDIPYDGNVTGTAFPGPVDEPISVSQHSVRVASNFFSQECLAKKECRAKREIMQGKNTATLSITHSLLIFSESKSDNQCKK